MRQEAVSDELGQFKVLEKAHTIWLPPLPIDMVAPDCTIQVTARGYGDEQFDYYDTVQAQHAHVIGNVPKFDLKRD